MAHAKNAKNAKGKLISQENLTQRRSSRKGIYNLTQRRRERRGFLLLSGYKTYTSIIRLISHINLISHIKKNKAY